MSTPNTMSQQHPQPRPPFSMPAANNPHAFSPPFPGPSPGLPPASPATAYNHPPAAKRPRLSPNPQSPAHGSPLPPTVQLPAAGSPGGNAVNGAFSPPAQGGVMQPPPRPAEKDKATDIRSIEDSLAGTGVNIDDEERALTTFGTPGNSQSQPNTSFLSKHSFGPVGGNHDRETSTAPNGVGADGRPLTNGVSHPHETRTPQETAKYEIDKANYIAGGRRQYELTDPFLHGDALERRLNVRAYENGIKSPKDGLYHARKDPNRPLQKMQVASPDGTVRVIDKGQTILNSDTGPALVNLMDLISLACKARITGILDLAARLGKERRDLANGRIPDEWKDIAQPPARAATPAAAPSLKRSHSQTDDSLNPPKDRTSNSVINVFRKVSGADRTREESRLNKRLRRGSNAPAMDASSAPSTPGAPGTPSTPLDSTKRVTKKDQKLAESKFTEAQQHKYANETARMATSNLIGGSNIFGNKKKTYAWMTGGGGPKPAPAPVAKTAAQINSALSDKPVAVVNASKPAITVPKGKEFGEWDDTVEKATAIPVRDILTILESDDRALKALQQGYNQPEGRG